MKNIFVLLFLSFFSTVFLTKPNFRDILAQNFPPSYVNKHDFPSEEESSQRQKNFQVFLAQLNLFKRNLTKLHQSDARIISSQLLDSILYTLQTCAPGTVDEKLVEQCSNEKEYLEEDSRNFELFLLSEM